MSVITISRGTFSGSRELAMRLAEKLGFKCLSREDLSDQAVSLGVPAGKLQTAMVKPPRVYQQMGRERDQYLACMTMLLCEKILEGNLVYYGHTGHMLLPGIPNILRIKVLADLEYRIRSVVQRLNISRNKAKEYIKNVDADRDKWVRFLYGIDWHDPFNYDIVINLAQTGIDNAASALCAMAELPDFKLTPASLKAINNLYLSSKAHFALTTDPRTSFADVKVTANEGIVQVNYFPQHAEVAPYVREVLSTIEEIKEVHTTIAQSCILFIQDNFNPESEAFANVVRVAKKWDAAVELMHMAVGGQSPGTENYIAENLPPAWSEDRKHKQYNGGIEDDIETEVVLDEGLSRSLDELRRQGCSGGNSTFYGSTETLLSMLQRRSNYSMVIIGDLFMGKGDASRIRLRAEMKSLLTDNLNLPVVESAELKEQFQVSLKQIVKMAVSFIIALILFTAVFSYQNEVITFLSGEEYRSLRILAVLFVLLITPLFAYNYGTFTRQILRLFGLD